MEKNIYDLLNEVEVKLEDYPKVKLSEIEERKLMKKYSQTTNKIKNTKRYIGIASAMVIAVGTIGAVPVLAAKNPTAYKIASFLGLEKDMAAYESIIGQEVTKEGVTMTINEVILNHDKLLVSVTTTSEESMGENYRGPGGKVYINGEEINAGARWSSELIDEYTGHSVMTFPLNHIPEGTVSIRLELNTPLSGQKRSPHWEYEFTADGEALKQDTQRVDVNKTYKLDKGGEITFLVYQGNALGQVLSYESSQSFLAKDMEIMGVDANGNEMTFISSGEQGGKGEFVVQAKDEQTAADAKEITFQIYMGEQPVGESFVINKN